MLAILGSTLISEDYFMKWTYQKSTHTFLERKICSQIYIISTEMRSQKYVYEQYYLIQITLKLTVWKAMDHKNTKNPIFWYHWILKRLHTCEKGDHIIEIIISTDFICIFLLINISFITPGIFYSADITTEISSH